MQEQLILQPINAIAGEITLPGSKSVSNRALLLAALAKGATTLTNLLDSDDVRYMLQALKALGINLQLSDDRTTCEVIGHGGPLFLPEELTLFLGNAGTAMRPLAAALSLSSGNCVLTGEARMQERPIAHLVTALRQGGAAINYLGNEGYPPILTCGGFQGGDITIDASVSSQFLTALLMIAPLAPVPTRITLIGELVSRPYIDITLKMMQQFGVQVTECNGNIFEIPARQRYCSPGHYLVEGDASSASYFLAAAAIKGGKVRVNGIGRHSMQGDIHFAEVLEKMGAVIEWGDEYITCQHNVLHGIDMDMNHIPDAAMTLATLALFAEGSTVIRNIYNWRVKETDRLAAMATELRKVGAVVEEGNDFIHITPPNQFRHAEIDTYNDHRMAMCFSLLALSDQGITINDPACTTKTFPDYFNYFARLAS